MCSFSDSHDDLFITSGTQRSLARIDERGSLGEAVGGCAGVARRGAAGGTSMGSETVVVTLRPLDPPRRFVDAPSRRRSRH